MLFETLRSAVLAGILFTISGGAMIYAGKLMVDAANIRNQTSEFLGAAPTSSIAPGLTTMVVGGILILLGLVVIALYWWIEVRPYRR